MSFRKTVLLIILLSFKSITSAAETCENCIEQFDLTALDNINTPIAGLSFRASASPSSATTPAGRTVIYLSNPTPVGEKVEILLVNQTRPREWFLLSGRVNLPALHDEVVVVVLQQALFAELLRASADQIQSSTDLNLKESQRLQALNNMAETLKLDQDQLLQAIQSFSQGADQKEQGIAAYLQGDYERAETLLQQAEEIQRTQPALKEYIDTLDYLGRAQYERGRYSDAAANFRKALVLDESNTEIMSWFGNALYETAMWEEAEDVHRRALAIDESSFGPDHPEVARDLNNLATLLQDTNRLSEAEPLMHRALAIGEHSYGPDHPNVAAGLNNLAQLLQATNRLSEAEPLMRRALAIDEHNFGPDHPDVASDLNNLAQLLQATNRLSEAEPLMHRALAIDEHSFGPDHPNIALRLNNLAALLQATNRLSEAELLMRRVIAIFEHSYGESHPHVATALNNLARLLQDTNRLSEAEPLMLRAITILLHFSQINGHEHPNFQVFLGNYRYLLQSMNLTEPEIEAKLNELNPQNNTKEITQQKLDELKKTAVLHDIVSPTEEEWENKNAEPH